MAKKVLTLATIQAVFDIQDPAPIKIVVTDKKVTASRDDTTLTASSVDPTLTDKVGEYALTFKEDGTHQVVFMKAAEKATRQTPAFDSL